LSRAISIRHHAKEFKKEKREGSRLLSEFCSSGSFHSLNSTTQKAKLKLGKGKQLPSNVVDTSFKARSEYWNLLQSWARMYLIVEGIALPTQSIAVEKDATLPTTRRKQSFDDLLSLMKHYNANTRKGMCDMYATLKAY
jgi:type IV secretory pathway VirB4 component